MSTGEVTRGGETPAAPADRARGDEQVVQSAFRESTQEGVSRLRRSWPALFATGAVGGIDLGFGVLALFLVRDLTGSDLLGGLAFSIGFVALVLAKSELFTENFLVPIAAVIAESGTWGEVLRLWFGTAVTNLAGGWVIMGLIILGVPQLTDSRVVQDIGIHFIEQGISGTTFASAVLGGAVLTLMTWMERGNDSAVAKLAAAVAAGFLLAATPLLHSIVSSLEMFAALQAGAPFGYLDWAGMFGWAVLGNVVGGLLLITTLRFVQVGIDTIQHHRDQPSR